VTDGAFPCARWVQQVPVRGRDTATTRASLTLPLPPPPRARLQGLQAVYKVHRDKSIKEGFIFCCM